MQQHLPVRTVSMMYTWREEGEEGTAEGREQEVGV